MYKPASLICSSFASSTPIVTVIFAHGRGGGVQSYLNENNSFTTGFVTDKSFDTASGQINSYYQPLSINLGVPEKQNGYTKPGDTDSDGDVDIFDYNNLLSQFGQTTSGLSADFDSDGDVDIFDYNTLLTNFGS